MVKKIIFLFSLFAILAGINFFLVFRIKFFAQKDAHIKKILAEISQIDPKDQFNVSSGPTVLGSFQTEAKLSDSRVANLKSFFRKHNSPLFDFADLIVSVSDEYHFDYRLLPAIAMQESGLCKYIPDDSHNCWGWGIYSNTVTKFESFDEAIKTVAKGLKEQYLDKGLITASTIMEKYTPSSQGSWAHSVNTFLKILE